MLLESRMFSSCKCKLSWLGSIVCLFVATVSLPAQQLTGNWSVVPAPAGDVYAFVASNPPTWKLRSYGEHVVASHWTRYDREQAQKVALPEHLLRDWEMRGVPVTFHLDHGGWLIGFDGGEFGGGLWSTNEDGSQTQHLLSSQDVHAIVPALGGAIVLAGVAHMSLDEGSAFWVPSSAWNSAEIHRIADLKSSPEASIQDSPSTVLVATNKEILRIDASGTLQRLFEMPNGSLSPRSVVVMDGTIYVGLRGYLLRLMPVTNGYHAEWLIPAA